MFPIGADRERTVTHSFLNIASSCIAKRGGLTFGADPHPVVVEKPDPQFARIRQQAIGGVEGEIRVCMQYFFQAWGNRAPSTKYRDMLLHTATEEIGHIEMLATAVALNLYKHRRPYRRKAQPTESLVR